MSATSELRLLLVHLFATSALTGLIWTIQIVHYPLFAQVSADRFVGYEQSHSFRVSTLVGPLMGVELICALLIVWKLPTGTSATVGWAALGVLLLVHLCTMVFSVPAHTVLGLGFSADAHQRLVQTNWIRTIGWSVRAAIAAYMLMSLFTARMSSAG
jgi:hypothetical protein